MSQNKQVVVLGGGPGGYAAAFRAADLGLDTVVVEQRGRLGGVCLWEGCIPSKSLLHVSRTLAQVEEISDWGVRFEPPDVDIDVLRRRKNKGIEQLAKGLDGLAKRRNVRLIQARGRLISANRLQLEGENLLEEQIEFENLILATGSQPSIPSALKTSSNRWMTSKEALELPDIPETLLIIGGAYVGLEMATTYARLGTKVTVVEMLDTLMPGIDEEMVGILQPHLEDILEEIRLKTTVKNIETDKEGLSVTMTTPDGETKEQYDRVLVAIGRKPSTADLGLEQAGVELDDNGYLKVDEYRRTSQPNIFAVGDITGNPQLAHKAFAEGKVAAEVIASQPAAFDPRAIPAVVFTDPEIAVAGMNEAQAQQAGIDVRVAKFPWSASGRASTLSRQEGLTKLLFDARSQRVVGAQIVGLQAGDLIGECVLAMETGCPARDLAESIHPHPTLSETVSGAAEVLLGLATDVPSKE